MHSSSSFFGDKEIRHDFVYGLISSRVLQLAPVVRLKEKSDCFGVDPVLVLLPDLYPRVCSRG
jgi:hypothetical protein